MANIRKILVPYDFSDTAKSALEMACDLSRRYEAELVLFHAYQVPGMAFPEGFIAAGPEMVNELVDRVEKSLAEARKEAEGMGAHKVSTATAQGVPFAEIVRFAREGDFDLVVMGTHGRTGLRHALLGSVAEKVVRKSPVPVLTVRSPEFRFEHP